MLKQLFKILLIPILLLTAMPVIAQSPSDQASDHKAYKKGERLFKKGNYVEAEEQFQILLDSGYKDNDLIAYQAQVHLELHEPHAAKDVILLSAKRNQDLDYLLAISHFYLEEYDDAHKELSLITDTATYHAEDLRRRIENAVKHHQDAQGYVIQNFGPEVNTKYQEYAAVMFDGFNELLFTSRNDSSEYTAHDGLAFETIHDTSIDSLNEWHVADPFDFHTGHEKRHDATVQVYQQGKKMVTFHNGRLYTSHLVDSTWVEDGPLDIHGFDGVDTHCFIADDESFIIFSSDFHSYGHNLDLYVSYMQEDSTWGEPEGLAALNTDFDEDAPFLAGDSTLYFSSRGHGSLGGYDVFRTTYDKKKKQWSEPVNLDYPINTVAEDIYFSTYGRVGYISSTRVGGYGSLDLYRILLFNEFMIEGLVVDKQTKEPIPDVQIELVYDSLYFRTYSDSTGRYEMFVPVNKDITITFVKESKPLFQAKYYVDVFFREKDNRVYNFKISNNMGATPVGAEPTLIHIEMKNDFEEDPFIVSIAKDEISQWSDSLKNYYEQQRIASLAGPGTVTVYLGFNSTELSLSARDVLKELYNEILTHKGYSIEISGHTDTVGSLPFNQRLSLKRATVVAKYLFGLGLEKNQTAIIGHGETKLIASDNSEESHAKNRRVEIKFY